MLIFNRSRCDSFSQVLNRLIKLLFSVSIPLIFSSALQAQNCSVNAGLDNSFCENSLIDLSGNVSVININPSTLEWNIVSQPVGGDAIIDNPNSVTSTVSGTLVPGNYTFELSIECTDFLTATDQVVHTIVEGPGTASVSTSYNAGCYSGGGINISGNSIGTGETVSWKVLSGSGTLTNATSRTVSFFPNESKYSCREGSNGYEATLSYTKTKNGCTSSDQIVVYYTYEEIAFFVEADPTYSCGLCTELHGACNLDGSGIWTYTGPGTATYALSETSANTEVCVDVEGDYTFTWTVTGGCRSGTGSTEVTFNDMGSTPIDADAGEGDSWCSYPSTLVLNAEPTGVGQTGVWTQLSGAAATITDANSANTTVTGITSGGGPYRFSWTITPDGNGLCDVSDEVSFWERPEWGFYDLSEFSCINYSSINVSKLLETDPYPWQGFDSIDITILFRDAPVGYEDSVIFWWRYEEREAFSDASGSNNSIKKDTAIVGVPRTITVTKSWLASVAYASYQDEDYFVIRADLHGNNGNYQAGAYDYEITIGDDCATYEHERSFIYSAKNGFFTPNAGTDVNLSCGSTSTSLAATGMYSASPENHKAKWSMLSGPSSSPLTEESAQTTNPVLTGLVPGTYVFRYSSDYGPDCEPVYDEMKVIVSSSPPTITSVSVDNPGFCGTGPVDIKALYSNDVHPDSVTWSITSPTVTTEILSDTSELDSSLLTLTDLLTSTNYTVQVRVANACGAVTQTVNFSTGTSVGPTKADIFTESTCTSSGLVTLEAAAVTSGTGTWSIISEPSGSLANIDDPSANPTTITGFTNLTQGRWVIQWEVSNSPACAQTSIDTIIIARGALTTPEAGPDLNFCGVTLPYTDAMKAEEIRASEAANDIYGEWRFHSGPSQPTFADKNSPTTDVTFSDYGEYILTWASTSGISCLEETDQVYVTVGEGAPAAFAGDDETRCGGSNAFTLDALDLAVGESGNWSVSSVTGNAAASFADATDPNTTATITGAGEVVLRWSTFSNTLGCPANSDELTIDYTPEASAGNDQSLCGTTSTLLTGNNISGISGATVAWSSISVPTAPSIDDAANYTTAVTGLSTGTYVFRYTLTNGACVLTDDINVVINPQPTVNAGGDFVFCDGETINLNGNTPSSGSTIWELVIGQNSGSFSSPNTPSTTYGTISDVSDVYLFSYTITDGDCAAYDYVEGYRLQNSSLSTTEISPTCSNSDGSIDLSVRGDDGTLTYLWNTGATSQDLSGVPYGNYSVTVSHPNGCSAELDEDLINSNGPSTSSSFGPICPNDPTVIAPTITGGTAPYTFLWESGATSSSISVDPTADSTYTFTVTDDTGCSNDLSVPVSVRPVATVSLGEDIMNCGSGNVTLTPTISSPVYGAAFYYEDFESGEGTWTQGTDGVDDDYDWDRDAYTTSSSNTGPSAGDGDIWHMYTEASSRSNKLHQLTSQVFDLSSRSGTALSFSYHMYGSNMGSLEIFASNNGSTWNSVWSLSGDQGDSWKQDTVNLSAYDGESTVYVRFDGTTGNGYASDMAIDNISMLESSETYLWSTGATTTNITVNPASDTQYYVDITDANGCVISDTMWVFQNCVLPVEWLDFSVKQENANAQLQWATSQESNSDRFVVERSIDNNAFQAIGEIAAAGNSQSVEEYGFTDPNITILPSPVLFYRLRQLDLDGNFEFSKTIELKLSKEDLFLMTVYPNPADELVNIRFNIVSQTNENKQLKVINAVGQMMHEQIISPEQNTGEIQIETQSWANGIYYIQLAGENGSSVVKLSIK